MRAAGRTRLDVHRAEQVNGSIDRSRGLTDRSAVISVPFVHQGADSTNQRGINVIARVG